MRVLLTGMSGTGKSALVHELRRRGYAAHDADEGFTEPRADGRWGWRADLVADLLAHAPADLLFFAGCSEEQATLPFDYRVLLTAPRSVLVERLRTRTSNAYGRDDRELAQVLADLDEVEPLLRRSADLVLTTTAPTAELADVLLRRIADQNANASPDRRGTALGS
jgi:shikimate kinase